MNFEDLKNPEFQEKLKNASSPEELMALAKEEGITLSDEQLDQISGGKGKWAHEECKDFVRQGKPRKK